MRAKRSIPTIVAVVSVLGMPGTASAADPPIFDVTNIGFDAAIGFVDVSGQVAFGVSEADQGATDLNGDGDAADVVLHVFDPVTASVTNTLLATTSAAGPTAVNGKVAFAVPESDQAGIDLNGDGDALDEVVHVFDLTTATATNTGFAGKGLAAGGGRLAFTVEEASQGATDLNGDGDATDDVVHVFDPVAATVTNTLLAVDPFASRTAFAGGVFGFPVDEADQAGTDLNADGDILDNVFHTFDPATAISTNVATAAFSATPAAGTFAFGVLESDQGATDLNGDGDVGPFEAVLHVYDPATATLTNVAVESSGGESEILGVVAFTVSEAAQGATDLNADGDAIDLVQHLYDPATATLTNLALNFGSLGVFQTENGFFGMTVSEAAQGATDLNGDGDAVDFVSYQINPLTGVATSTMLAANPSAGTGTGFGVFIVDEGAQGATDLNADGDTLDEVAHAFDVAAGTSTNLMLDAGGLLPLGATVDGRVTLEVREAFQGATDLNADGDAADSVLHLVDPATAVTTNLGVAVPFQGVSYGDRLAFVVSEAGQGVDLNGDGDTLDEVLHSLFINDPPTAVADGPFAVDQGGMFVGSGLLGNDSDPEGTPLSAIKVTDPSNGAVILNADGSFTYTHDGSATVTDSFTYRAFDGALNSDPVTVSFTITPAPATTLPATPTTLPVTPTTLPVTPTTLPVTPTTLPATPTTVQGTPTIPPAGATTSSLPDLLPATGSPGSAPLFWWGVALLGFGLLTVRAARSSSGAA